MEDQEELGVDTILEVQSNTEENAVDAPGPLDTRSEGTDKNLGGAWLWVNLLSLVPRATFGIRS